MIRNQHDSPHSPRPRRVHVTGPAMNQWFREQGWIAEAGRDAVQHAFVDEMSLSGIAVRRIWHTPVAMTRAMDADVSIQRVWLQVQASCRIRDARSVVSVLGEREALVWTGKGLASLESTHPVARIEVEVDPAGSAREEALLHLKTDETALHTVWTCLAGTVNVLLNADIPLDDRSSRFLAQAVTALADAISRPPASGDGAAGADIVRAARQLLAANAMDATYTVGRAAEEIGVSRSHLTRLLSAAGESPREVLRAVRVEAARRAFALDPHADPHVVAENSGFRSVRALRGALHPDTRGPTRARVTQAPSAASAIAADASSSLIHSGRTRARMPAASTSAADAASSSASNHASSTPSAERAP